MSIPSLVAEDVRDLVLAQLSGQAELWKHNGEPCGLIVHHERGDNCAVSEHIPWSGVNYALYLIRKYANQENRGRAATSVYTPGA